MKLSPTPIEPIRKTRNVPLDVADAFDLFTIRMDTWWPLAGFSISEDQASCVRFESHLGGRIVEVTPDGIEYEWADVIAWDPPHRFAVAWHPSIEPHAATILEVRFRAIAGGGTEIELEHRAWEELGTEDGQRTRDGYDGGWDLVLEPLEATATLAAQH